MSNKIWAIVPSAGSGKRFGGSAPKQYTPLQGKQVIHRTLDRLHAVLELSGILVGVAAETDLTLSDPSTGRLNVETYIGGATRSETVLKGLKRLIDCGRVDEWALIHDAARPLITPELVSELINSVGFDARGGFLAIEVVDTLKKAKNGRSLETIDRGQHWCAQTPQLFPVGRLFDALCAGKEKNITFTDEANAMEFLGYTPLLVKGSRENLKLTEPEDMIFASAILDTQEKTS
ncbi:2-C-methyl-D-erythritol 4-phosphate cytidylyltransferase [Arenicellales bacterium IMCC57338]